MAGLSAGVATPFAPRPWLRWWLIVGFWPIVLFALGSDSLAVWQRGFDGQILSNIVGPLYLALMLPALRPEQQLMALIFVPFSALGELVFSLVFQLYTYKLGSVPLYVPFGHAILFTTGMLIAESGPVLRRVAQVRWALIAFHAALFGGAVLALGDTLSALFLVLFVWVMVRKRANVLYLIVGVLVLYIELVGTAFGCWVWHPQPFGVLRTTNPPVGAFVCYVLADLAVMRLARKTGRWLARFPALPLLATNPWYSDADQQEHVRS